MHTAISLFAGAGGCSLGFKESGFEILSAYDFNPSAVNTYNRNFGQGTCKLIDLSLCDFADIRTQVGLKPGELDLIMGGPPCQGFSSAGPRFWNDPRNQLIRNYAYALEEFQPKWFFMENVEGLLTSAQGQYVFEAVKRFGELGYSVVLQKVYSQEYGIPQRRKRVFIIGNNLGINFFPPTQLYPVTGPIFRNSPVTLRSAIEDLENVTRPDINHVPKYETGINVERYRHLKPGQSMKDLPEYLQHESFQRRANRRVKDGTATEKRGGAPSGLKRLVYDEPSLTITSAATREFVHPVADRTLTLRECARIQTFPDEFTFLGTETQVAILIGNAIPPKLAKIFADHLQETHLSGIRGKVEAGLIDYVLTKSGAMSPALARTDALLRTLNVRANYRQGSFFDNDFQTTTSIL